MTIAVCADEFRATLFGSFSLRKGDVCLTQASMRSKQLAKLLALLICFRDNPLSSAKLMELLWPDTADDPAHALSNLVYRLRKVLATAWPDDALIISQAGQYRWNPDIRTVADVWVFDECINSVRLIGDDIESPEPLERLVEVYAGKFLEEFSDDFELLSQQSSYHRRYLDCAKRLIGHYERLRAYEDVERVCRDVGTLEPADNRIHCAMMRALIGMNRFAAAEEYYRMTINVMRQYMNADISQEMRELYERMQAQINDREIDLDQIMTDMNEDDDLQRAFLCEYGFFRKIYSLRRRTKDRRDGPISLVLISLCPEDDKANDVRFEESMELLQGMLLQSLRRGDALTRYSSSQFLLMFDGCPMDNASIIVDRIAQQFYSTRKRSRLILQYSTREITRGSST